MMDLSLAFGLKPGEVVAFVGGGGKTTAMFRLAAEATRQQKRVLVTTSTRIFAAQIKLAPAHLTFDPATQTLADILPRLETAIAEHGQILLIGQTDPASGKAFGLPPDIVDGLAASGRFDVILNEADGSRMRPFKAPASHEPVIPVSTSLVVPVVGLDVLEQPLDDAFVHRAELVSRLSGIPLGQPLTPTALAAVLSHPAGGLKNVPPPARVIPLLNKVDRPTRLTAARQIARNLLTEPRIDSVAIGAVQATTAPILEVQNRTALVILAAGSSSRFGSAKQLALWQGQTFIERVVETALAVPHVAQTVVVLGAETERCRAILADKPVEVIINPRWAEGQSSSMRAGLATLADNITQVIFLLVDLPGLTPEIITALIERHRQTLAPLVWPEFEGRRGNPVLFDRALFAELGQISGDTGGRPLLQRYAAQAERVAVASPAILQDVDRPEDLKKP